MLHRYSCLLLALWLFQLHTPASARDVPVLIYHEIVTEPMREAGETVIHLERFAAQMRHLHEAGYTTLSMDELVAFMKGERDVPERSVVLSFDDGWANQQNALPILQRYGFKASFWIFPEKGIGWPYMEWAQIEAIAASPLFEIGSHSMTHPWDRQSNLVSWADGREVAVLYELVQSKATLEERLQRPIRYFAWPCGWYTDRLVRLAKAAGYEALLTAEEGANRAGGDVLRIKRLFVDGACELAVFTQSLSDHRYRVCQTQRPPTRGHLPQP